MMKKLQKVMVKLLGIELPQEAFKLLSLRPSHKGEAVIRL